MNRTFPLHVRFHATTGSRPAILVLVCTAMLMLHYYLGRPDTIGVFSEGRGWIAMTNGGLPPIRHFVASAMLLAIVPILVARFVCGLHLRDIGLGLGNWREGLVWLSVGLPLAVFSGWIAGGQPGMQAVYPLDPRIAGNVDRFIGYAAAAFLYYGSWEIMFRGVLLFGLASVIGFWSANGVQTGLSVTAHFGRDLTETFSAIPGGLLFGFICFRTRSIWYVAIVHWVLGMSTEWFAATGL